MANILPPPPINSPPGSTAWADWQTKLHRVVAMAGGILWASVDKTGSNLTDIVTRAHNSLQSLQGGTSNEYYHLSSANYTDLTDSGDSALHFHSTDRNRANHTGTQLLSTISNVTITATNLNVLDDGVNTTLHFHDADRARSNHTGSQLLSTISDVSISSSNLNVLDDGVDTTLHFHAADRARANHTGTQTMSTISDLPTLVSGTYTPTLFNVANLDASTSRLATYMRVGNTVTVSGQVDVDPTTTLTTTQLGISLPIASSLTTAFQLGGVASALGIASMSAGIQADATNDRAEMQWKATDVTNQTMTYTFTYQIL